MSSSMFVVNNSFSKVSSVGLPPQVSNLYPNKVSRVCFPSVSRFNTNQFPRVQAGGDEEIKKYTEIKQQAKENDDIDNVIEGTKQNTEKGKEWASETGADIKEKTEGAAEWASDKAKEGADSIGDTLKEAKQNNDKSAEWVADKAKEGFQQVGDNLKDATENTKEALKEALDKN